MSLKELVGTKNYRLGSQGEVVKAIQLALAKLGYPLRGTGYFGSATDVAVTAAQKKAAILADGVVGPDTAQMIDDALAGKTSSSPLIEVTRPLWLQAGLQLLGTKEKPGPLDNPQILEWAKEEGGSIERTYDHDSIAWCALFVGHCLTLASLKGTGTLWALDYAGKWPSQKVEIAVGAVAPMARPGGGHVILVVGRDQHGNVMGLGGNQSDEVSVRPFPLSRLNRGFWWPIDASPPSVVGFKNLPIVKSDGRVSVREA